MKEFKPKTRLQMYKEAKFGSIENIPDKYFIEETETLIDNKELTFGQSAGDYIANLCDSSIILDSQDVVKIDNVVIPYFDDSATYQTGDLFWYLDRGKTGTYNGALVASIGASPSGTKHASVYRTIRKLAIPPRTKTELYYAMASRLFYVDEIEVFTEHIDSIPKTTNEKLTALECEFPVHGEFDFSPKTRSQWYRAKALELVEELPSKVEQVALAEDVAVTWIYDGKEVYYCDIYEQEEEFSGSKNITVTLNGDEIPEGPGQGLHAFWDFKRNTKIRVFYESESEPVGNFVASVYLAKEELLIPPKTNIEKYYAYKAGLYEGELPEPKTVDEYYIALECGWRSDEESVAVPVGPINPGMNEGAQNGMS